MDGTSYIVTKTIRLSSVQLKCAFGATLQILNTDCTLGQLAQFDQVHVSSLLVRARVSLDIYA